MLKRELALKAVAKHGSQVKAARALGVPRTTLQNVLRVKGPKTPAGNAVGFTRDDFRKKYDKSYIVPARIREALKKLGPNHYLPEGEFIRLAGISNADMGAYRAEFEDDHVFTVDRTKRLWCGSRKLADVFRGDNYG